MRWKKRIRHLVVVEHLTKKEACKRIEKEFKAPASTIALYTAPCKYKAPSQYQGNDSQYNTQYVKTRRNIDKILPRVFNGNSELSLKAISDGIDNLSGISLKERTLEKLVGKYEGLPRGPPILKTETGNYRLNDLFYKN